MRHLNRRLARLPLLAVAALFAVATIAAAPLPICTPDGWGASGRAPVIVDEYLRNLDGDSFDLRTACARWAGTFSRRHQRLAESRPQGPQVAPRFILFPGGDLDVRRLAVWLSRIPHVRAVERAQRFVVAELDRRVSTQALIELLDAPQIAYFEPDCDGPDFLTKIGRAHV